MKRQREEDFAKSQQLAGERASKKAKKLEDLEAIGAASLAKLRAKSGDGAKLTMGEMQSALPCATLAALSSRATRRRTSWR